METASSRYGAGRTRCATHGSSIALTYRIFGISKNCFRYPSSSPVSPSGIERGDFSSVLLFGLNGNLIIFLFFLQSWRCFLADSNPVLIDFNVTGISLHYSARGISEHCGATSGKNDTAPTDLKTRWRRAGLHAFDAGWDHNRITGGNDHDWYSNTIIQTRHDTQSDSTDCLCLYQQQHSAR